MAKPIKNKKTIQKKLSQRIADLKTENSLFKAGYYQLEREVAKRKKTEKRLLESEKRYRDLYEEAPNIYFVVSADNRIIIANKRTSKELGYPMNKLMGMSRIKLFADTPSGKEKVENIIKMIYAGEENISDEVEMRRADGSNFWVILSLRPLKGKKGDLLAYRSIATDITARKKAEEVLRSSEKKYSTLVEKGNDGILIIQKAGILKYVNSIICNMTGCTEKEVIGKSFLNYIPPEYRKSVAEKYEKRMKGENIPNRYEIEILAKNGERTPVEINASKIDYEGQPAIMAIVRDISSRKKIEKALKESEENYRTILHIAKDGFWIIDENGRLLEINDAYCQMSGYSKQELLNMNVGDLEANETKNDIAIHMQKIKTKGYDFFETKHRRKDGSTFDIEAIVQYRPEKIGRFVAFIRDITERKKTSDIIKQSEKTLKKAEKIAGLGNWNWNILTNELIWSEGVYRIYGMDPLKDKPSYDTVVKTVAPECRNRFVKAVEDAVKYNKIFDGEYRMTGLDGVERYTHTTAEVLRDYEGRPISMLGVVQDISEHKRTEKELKKIVEKLKELDKLKTDFLNNTTHELKTPLVPIRSQAQLLLAGDYGPINEQQREAIKMILRNEENLSRLSGEILDIPKIRSGKLKLYPEKISLEKVITDECKDMEKIAQKKQISCSHSFDPEMPQILADKRRIGEVVSNLLDNAIKFTPEGGAVKIKVYKKENDAIITVEDTGIGLNRENIEKLFTPFFQIQSSLTRRYRGTGLGLAICKGIVEAHGGRIWAESKGEGYGSIFGFSLPIIPDAGSKS